MRNLLLLSFAITLLCSCGNSGASKTFCDTACGIDSLNFAANDSWKSYVRITLNDCEPDSIGWSYQKLGLERQIKFREYVTKSVRVNKSSVNVAFQDTSDVWLSMNDCMTGRGYLFKLPYRKGNIIKSISGALNSIDPKFSVASDLRAYSDGGNIYVVNVTNGQEAQMTFKEDYKVDFNNVHKYIDSINVTKDRIYVKLLKEGKEVPMEKKIAL